MQGSRKEGSNDKGAAVFVRLIGMEAGKALFKFGRDSSSGSKIATVSIPNNVSEAIRLQKNNDRLDLHRRFARAVQEVWSETVEVDQRGARSDEDAVIVVRSIGMGADNRMRMESDRIDHDGRLTPALQKFQSESAMQRLEDEEKETSDEDGAMNFAKLVGTEGGKSKYFFIRNGLLSNRAL